MISEAGEDTLALLTPPCVLAPPNGDAREKWMEDAVSEWFVCNAAGIVSTWILSSYIRLIITVTEQLYKKHIRIDIFLNDL